MGFADFIVSRGNHCAAPFPLALNRFGFIEYLQPIGFAGIQENQIDTLREAPFQTAAVSRIWDIADKVFNILPVLAVH